MRYSAALINAPAIIPPNRCLRSLCACPVLGYQFLGLGRLKPPWIEVRGIVEGIGKLIEFWRRFTPDKSRARL
jgi:hypothetical protein